MAYLDQLEIAERWGAVVDAAGMFSPLQSPHNLLLLGGAIMNDDVVAARRAPSCKRGLKPMAIRNSNRPSPFKF